MNGPRSDIETIARHLSRNRGLRVGLIGGALVLVGLVLGAGSVWTVPALVLGSVLVLAGALGTRCTGRLALEWGGDGASFEMRAKIAPPEPAADAAQLELASANKPDASGTQVIEGSGETIEMDLIKLQELLPTSKNAGESRATTPPAPGA